MRTTILSVLCLAFVAVARAATCTDSCGNNNGASSVLGACQHGSTCSVTVDSCINCLNCPAGYSGFRCEIPPGGGPPAGPPASATPCYDSCGSNNGASSYLGACQHGSTCTLGAGSCIYCSGCPAGYSGYRCEVPPAGTPKIAGQVCGADNGAQSAGGACQNGSKCTLTPEGYVYCTGCPAGNSGYRCEVGPATTAPKIAGQVCGNDNGAQSAGGACLHGSTCTITTQGYVYCTGCVGYTGYRCETPAK